MVIFGTGVVTGSLLVRHVEHGRDRHPQHSTGVAHPAPASSAGVMRIEFLRRMERELDLTPDQREPVDKVLKEGQERTKKLMETVEPRRREEFKKTLEEFRAVLTPEQRKRFAPSAKPPARQSARRNKLLVRPPPAQPQRVANHYQIGQTHRRRAEDWAHKPERRERHADGVVDERPK